MINSINFCGADFKITDLKVGTQLTYADGYTCVVEFNKGFVVVTKDCGFNTYRCYDLKDRESRELFAHRFEGFDLSFVGKPVSEVYDD